MVAYSSMMETLGTTSPAQATIPLAVGAVSIAAHGGSGRRRFAGAQHRSPFPYAVGTIAARSELISDPIPDPSRAEQNASWSGITYTREQFRNLHRCSTRGTCPPRVTTTAVMWETANYIAAKHPLVYPFRAGRDFARRRGTVVAFRRPPSPTVTTTRPVAYQRWLTTGPGWRETQTMGGVTRLGGNRVLTGRGPTSGGP